MNQDAPSGFVRDPHTGCVVNTNEAELLEYKRQRAKLKQDRATLDMVRRLADRVDELSREIESLKRAVAASG